MSDESELSESDGVVSEGQVRADPNGEVTTGTIGTSSVEVGVPTSRAGQVWVAIVVGIAVLVLLLVFIFQNLHDARIHFFTATGTFPLALALLLSAIAGALIVVTVGSVRILQLRRHVRSSKNRAAVRAGQMSARDE